MENKKFTDEEIVKGLSTCNYKGSCDECPFEGVRFDGEIDCASLMMENAISLINRQKDEIKTWVDRYRGMHEVAVLKQQQARAEAIKEFAERLHEVHEKNRPIYGGALALLLPDIDQIAKEMTEGER